MTAPKLLDLFCCQGGAAAGYARAGFDVTGVDIVAQPRYPHRFVQADALDYLAEYGHRFDVIHASPPCQRYSTMTADPDQHPDLIGPTRAALIANGRPWVIENVAGAAGELHQPLTLCGSMFGLGVRRHRLFESPVFMYAPACAHGTTIPVGVYGDHAEYVETPRRPSGTSRGAKAKTAALASAALGGVDWMDWHGMRECIPPVYAEHLGHQLVDHLAWV